MSSFFKNRRVSSLDIPDFANKGTAFSKKGADEKGADEIIEEAKKEAENILKEAATKATLIMEDAKKRGFDEGFLKAKEEFKEETKDVMSRLENIFSELSNFRKLMFDQFSSPILSLSFEIAKKIIRKEIEEDKEFVLRILEEILLEFLDATSIIIKVNPSDFAIIEEFKPNILSRLKDLSELKLIADDSVEKGGVIVETDFGTVDGRISEQIEVIKEALLNGS